MGASSPVARRLLKIKQTLRLRTRTLEYARFARRRLHWKFRQKFIKTRLGIEPVRNFLIDRKYGGWCGGKFRTRFGHTGAHGTSSADYYQLRKLFCAENGIAITPSDVLVDIGCGRGRVLNWWLSLELGNRIIGIELDDRFASEAAQRLKPYPNVTVISGDAVQNMPADATIFHVFNSFNDQIMEPFKERLYALYKDRGNVTVVYQFCQYLSLWENDPRWVVEPVRTKTFYKSVIIRMRKEVS